MLTDGKRGLVVVCITRFTQRASRSRSVFQCRVGCRPSDDDDDDDDDVDVRMPLCFTPWLGMREVVADIYERTEGQTEGSELELISRPLGRV